ncbi:MAG: NtrZ family periplasmic regulatory protein [Caulobacteraceae bacterium]
MVRAVKGLAIAALLLMGMAATAHAETVRPRTQTDFASTFATGAQEPWSAPAPRKTLQWDVKGRWSLRLDMDQPATREMGWKDVQAGAYFRITPSLRVGGSVGMGDKFAPSVQVQPKDAAPRVHLETAFQF